MNQYLWRFKEELSVRGLWRNRQRNRKATQALPVQENAQLIVYWKKEKIGTGPSVSLEICGREVVRYDCFGDGLGHYHIFPFDDLRIYFDEKTVHEQIKRSLSSIRSNHPHYLRNHHSKKVRDVELKPDNLEKSLAEAKKLMIKYAKELENDGASFQ